MTVDSIADLSRFNPHLLVGVACLVGIAPLALGIATAYLKVGIVFGAIRNAFGGQQIPGPLITGAMSVAVTAIIMGPVFDESVVRLKAVTPSSVGALSLETGSAMLANVGEPWRRFLSRHAGRHEIQTLSRIVSRQSDRSSPEGEPSLGILLGAFMLSELQESFLMACVVLTPFIVVDLIVANILVGLGKFMVSPVLITLPLKIAIFCAVDGWLLITEALVRSYGEA